MTLILIIQKLLSNYLVIFTILCLVDKEEVEDDSSTLSNEGSNVIRDNDT